MNRILLKMITLAAFATVTLTAAACDGPLEQRFDCNAVCNRYADCFDSDYDVSECNATCNAEGDEDDSYRERVDDCESCLDGESCAESFSCTAECAGIVP